MWWKNFVAQNNQYSINDKLYPLYVRAYNQRMSADCLAIADSLRKGAIAIGDKHGELRALTIPMHHYYYKKISLAEYEKVVKPLLDKSMEYGLLTYYYLGVSNIGSFQIRAKKYIEALRYMDEQLIIARKKNYKRGVALCNRMIGVIHQYRGEYYLAIEQFEKTLDYSKKNIPTLDVVNTYQSICNCYRMMNDFESLLKTARDGLPFCRNRHTRYNMLLMECYGLFMLGRDEEFIKKYDVLKNWKIDTFFGTEAVRDAVKIAKDLYDGRDSLALAEIKKLGKISKEENIRMLIQYCNRKQAYKSSLDLEKRFFTFRDDLSETVQNSDERSTEAIYKNQELLAEKQRIAEENTKLELANAKLNLQNSAFELNRTKNNIKLAKLEVERNRLSSDYQKKMLQQLNDSIRQQQMIYSAKEHTMRMQNTILVMVVAVVALIVLLSIIYYVRNRVMTKRLRVSNEILQQNIAELNATKEKAKQAENAKTMFVQNMSHEIRTPLNAIVGFAQVLTSMGDDLEDEEKRNVTKMIADNSDLLTTLVNDIFNFTNTTDKKNYQINMTEVNINSVCRDVIETVRHRKADDVELIFTTELPDDYIVTTDMQRVAQVLINMLTNAEKNTMSGSITLDCNLREHSSMITMSVTDTGVGVPKEKMEEIFQRFNKLNAEKQGAGLGLDICRTIAEKLGGEINIDPEYTGGARFWFTIPCTQ